MAPSCILAVKTDLQHTEDMRPVTAIPKAQETEGFELRGLVVFCDVIRQIRSIDWSIPITLVNVLSTEMYNLDTSVHVGRMVIICVPLSQLACPNH